MEWSESRPRHGTKDGKSIRDNTLPSDLMKKEKSDLPSTKNSSRTGTVYAALTQFTSSRNADRFNLPPKGLKKVAFDESLKNS